MYFKRIGFGIMTCCFLGGAFVHAQVPVTGSLAKQMPHYHRLKPIQVSLALADRVERTYLQALATQRLDRASNWYPGLGATEWLSLRNVSLEQEVYPAFDFLTSNRQRAKYFLSRQNRETMRQMPLFQNYATILKKHLNELHKHIHGVNFTSFKEMDASSLSAVISPRTSYLLLGEGTHKSTILIKQASYLLQTLREQHPQRQIFLFTEFLPKEQIWSPEIENIPFPIYRPVWRRAYQLQIPVIGLEPSFVFNNFSATVDLHDGFSLENSTKTVNMWETLEGIRLRNEDWLSTLKKYRAKYPKALFVVYVGTDHINYAFPFSIGNALAGPYTHVAIIQPDWQNIPENRISQFSLWDKICEDQFSHQPFVKIDNKKLAKIVGFDSCLRVPLAADVAN